jgi:hypothetical protein
MKKPHVPVVRLFPEENRTKENGARFMITLRY